VILYIYIYGLGWRSGLFPVCTGFHFALMVPVFLSRHWQIHWCSMMENIRHWQMHRFSTWRRLCAMYLHICNTAVCLIVIDDGVFKSCQKLGGRGGGLGFPPLYRLRGGVSLDGRYNYPSYVIYSPFFPGGGGGECTPPYLHRLISNQACMADPLKKQIDILYVDNQYYPLC